MLCKLCVVVVVVIIQLACQIRAAYIFDVCEEDFCDKKDNACPTFHCEDGRIVENATTCGCCHLCITSLKEGEACATEYYGINAGNLRECGEGLTCSKTERICAKAPTKCIEEQKKFQSKPHEKQLMLQRQKPECDYFGFFKPVVCIPGVLCYCVDKDGQRIFGTDLATNNDTMKCDCSREIENFPKSKQVGDGNFPRCLPNGNYDPLQCSDERCFCLDSSFANDISVNDTLEKLICYDREMHKNIFTSNCWEERNAQIAILKNESFTAVVGLDITQCELDGSYSPVQCKKNECYCVTKNGKRYYNEYIVQRGYNAGNMTCRCARDKEILHDASEKTKDMKLFENLECDTLGNYKTKQTVGSDSFQVDVMGFRTT